MPSPNRRLERVAGQANAYAVLAHDRRRDQGRLLVPVGALSGVSTVTATRPVTGLIPALSCRSCRPNAPFAELVQLSRTSIADEMREEHRRQVWATDHMLLPNFRRRF